MIQHPIIEFNYAHTEDAFTVASSKAYSNYAEQSSKDSTRSAKGNNEFLLNHGFMRQDHGLIRGTFDISSITDGDAHGVTASCKRRGSRTERYLYRIDLAGWMVAANAVPMVGFGWTFTSGPTDGPSSSTGNRVLVWKWLPVEWHPTAVPDDDQARLVAHTLAGQWLVSDQGGPPTPPGTSALGATYNGDNYAYCTCAVFLMQPVEQIQWAKGDTTNPDGPTAENASCNGYVDLSIQRITTGDPGVIYRKF